LTSGDTTSPAGREEGHGENERDPALARRKDPRQPQALVSPLKTIELQVGEHVVRALQVEHTVAVVTTVIVSPDGSQSIVSMPLDDGQMSHVQQLLAEVAPSSEAGRVPCVGFHCYLPQLKKDRERGHE
jgi:hypothetical protein